MLALLALLVLDVSVGAQFPVPWQRAVDPARCG